MKYLALSSIVAVLLAAPASAADGVKAGSDGLTLKEGPLELNLGGRLHLDGAVFDDPVSGHDTDVAVRRARLELSGKLGKVVRFRVDREFAGRSKGWRNVWLAVEPVDNVEVKGGNFIVPFSAEDLQSSNTMPFVERSLASSIAPGFGLGGSVSAHGKSWTATAGYFTDPLDKDEGRPTDRGRGFVGRVTAAPVKSDNLLVHVALAGERRDFKLGDELRFSADPGSQLAPTLMSSGSLIDLDSLTGLTGELAASVGPVLVQAQHIGVKIERDLQPSAKFNGQTVQIGWLLTGGRYDYSSSQGVFDGPRLRRGKGAVELAARYSRLDLDDQVQRGIGHAWTGGANWYVNRNVRLMADYTRSRVEFSTGTAAVTNRVGVARFQLNF